MKNDLILQKLQQLEIYDDIKPIWTYIEPLLNDLGNTEDEISYHDSFLEIKLELEKVSNIQIDKVEDAAEYLCQNVGKDIRVIVYLTYALFRKENYIGLIKGLVLLYSIQILFPEIYQPKKIKTLKNILLWLSADKMENAFLLCQELPSKRSIFILNTVINAIQDEFSTQFKQPFDELNSLLSLIKTFDKNIKTEKVQSGIDNNIEQVKVHQNAEVAIKSSRDVMNAMKCISQYILNEEHNKWAAFHLIRIFRWDFLTQLPVNQEKVTKIASPRAELVNRLDTLYQKKDWQELLQECHSAFLEASNHFYLDLQYFSWVSIKELTQKNIWADILVSDLAFLLERLPGLELLSFIDNRPFASAETIDWINHNARIDLQNIDYPSITVENSENIDDNIEKQAFMILKNQDFDKTLAWLNDIEFDDSLEQQTRKKYLIAKLAFADKKLDFALLILEKINQDFSLPPLYNWNKKMTFDIKYNLLSILLQKHKINLSNPKTILPEIISSLIKDLIELNPNLVYELLYK